LVLEQPLSTSDVNGRRLRLVEQVLHLSESRLAEVERFLNALSSADSVGTVGPAPASVQRDWPHAPLHRISEHGTFFLTASTYRKEHHFRGPDRLDQLEAHLLAEALAAGWQLEAWAVFSNHYHFVGSARDGGTDLTAWIKALHQKTATKVNELDGVTKRQVWYNYRETALTFEASYMARLNYVHQNAVKHGLVKEANQYPWCSAGWFERTATPAQVKTIYGFKTDQLKVEDDFDPI
jgi:putative transposase